MGRGCGGCTCGGWRRLGLWTFGPGPAAGGVGWDGGVRASPAEGGAAAPAVGTVPGAPAVHSDPFWTYNACVPDGMLGFGTRLAYDVVEVGYSWRWCAALLSSAPCPVWHAHPDLTRPWLFGSRVLGGRGLGWTSLLPRSLPSSHSLPAWATGRPVANGAWRRRARRPSGLWTSGPGPGARRR